MDFARRPGLPNELGWLLSQVNWFRFAPTCTQYTPFWRQRNGAKGRHLNTHDRL